MRLDHDPSVNMAYLQLMEAYRGPVNRTVVLQDSDLPCDLAVDLDRDGRIVGIEIFDAGWALDPALLGTAGS